MPFQTLLKPAQSVVSTIALGLAALSALLIVALMVQITAEVCARAFFNIPFRGTAELASISIVVIVFLGLPAVALHNRLIQSDLLLRIVAGRSRNAAAIMNRGFDLVSAVFMGAIAWAIWPKLIRAIERGSFIGNEGDFTFPVWPKLAAILVGAGLTALVLLLRSLTKGDPHNGT